MPDEVARRVVVAGHHTLGGEGGQPLPQVGRGLGQPQVHVAAAGQGVQQLDLGDREPGVPEEREPLRQLEPATRDAPGP